MRSIRAESPRLNDHCARATVSWRREATRIGSMRSSTRLRRSRWRSPPRARKRWAGFPDAEVALDGWMEKLLPSHSATEIEDRYRALLRESRPRDAAAGRTLDGPHLSDLAVTHAGKQIPAADASTGEQKALLIRLVLAHARLIKEMTGFAPLLLLDEVIAHLDPARRAALYDAF